ncbi:MAG TPA: prepilin-type N-terminal cleavage/methylation domain-containing protein, partial [Sumerlaeia bacterium]|nr:prepilin-type N-terminal cleavage/methylation domain-containing protein [Sumerlaeia bacterium]
MRENNDWTDVTRPRNGPRKSASQRRAAFTLIELLIVVAIIAILAAIAVPNFLEAQVRSKVARVKSDMRSVATACESYLVDHNTYPTEPDNTRLFLEYIAPLSTPVAYLSSLELRDPFTPKTPTWGPGASDFRRTYCYLTYHGPWGQGIAWHPKCYIITSFGPDMEANPT